MQKDLISRQEAIETIMGQPPEPHYPSWYAAQIEGLPPAQVDLSEYSDKLWKSAYERGKAEAQAERKKGKWIFGFNNQYLEKYYYCSNCGCRKYTEDEPSDYFCSKCGADMRGMKDG